MRPCAVYTSSGAAHRLTDSLLVTIVVQGMDQLRQQRLDWRGNGSRIVVRGYTGTADTNFMRVRL